MNDISISKTSAVVVAGDFDIFKLDPSISHPFVIPHYNSTIHRLIHGGRQLPSWFTRIVVMNQQLKLLYRMFMLK